MQVVDTANAAQQGLQEMQSECSTLQAENAQMRSVVKSLEVQVSELQADVETRGSALGSLESTLSKIERSVDTGRDRSPCTGTLSCLFVIKGDALLQETCLELSAKNSHNIVCT